MTKSPAKPKPVRVGRYRYSKLRWRLLVHALDFCGTIVDGDRPADSAGRGRSIVRAGSWSCSSTTWATRCSARP